MEGEKMIIGTPYFDNVVSARRYYAPYSGDGLALAPKAYVLAKIGAGEIYIGKPPLKPGQRAELIPGEGRYRIIEEEH